MGTVIRKKTKNAVENLLGVQVTSAAPLDGCGSLALDVTIATPFVDQAEGVLTGRDCVADAEARKVAKYREVCDLGGTSHRSPSPRLVGRVPLVLM